MLLMAPGQYCFMNESETYNFWKLVADQPQKMIVDSVHDEDEGLIILLRYSSGKNESKLLRLLYDPYISYGNMDESYRVRAIDNCAGKLRSTFYIVKDSNFIEWFHEESKNIYKDRDIVHYAIITVADCIDILSDYPPEISWINR